MKSSRLNAVEGGALGNNRKRRYSSLKVASRKIGLGSNSRLHGF